MPDKLTIADELCSPDWPRHKKAREASKISKETIAPAIAPSPAPRATPLSEALPAKAPATAPVKHPTATEEYKQNKMKLHNDPLKFHWWKIHGYQ